MRVLMKLKSVEISSKTVDAALGRVWVVCTVARCESGATPRPRNTLAVHSLSDVRNERNNAALHATDIAVAIASAAEIE